MVMSPSKSVGLKSTCADADVEPDMVADGVAESIANLVALLLITSMLVTGYSCGSRCFVVLRLNRIRGF